MSLKISSIVCDRCGREFSPPDGYVPSREPKVSLRFDGLATVEFLDLCSFCNKEVNVLLEEIAYPKGSKKGEEAAQGELTENKGKQEPQEPQEEPKKEETKKDPEKNKSDDGYDF